MKTYVVCRSVANILGIRKEAVEVFLARKMPDYVCRGYQGINIDIFYDYFGVEKDTFIFDTVTFYHVTTRLSGQEQGEFKIDNLETLLLSDNPLTKLCRKYDNFFKREAGISVYYQGKRSFLTILWKQDCVID